MAHLINPKKYIGYDVNNGMVIYASKSNPTYLFTNDEESALTFKADATLLYTVISMWNDVEARAMLKRLTTRLVIIGEIADSRWRSPEGTVPMIYNRDIWYIDALMNESGYVQIDHQQAEHERYVKWSNDWDKNMHILVYSNAKHTG
jgi:hypothetical protein